MSFTRIGSNTAASQSFNALLDVNRQIASRLLRLSTGKRINSVGDDAAGFALARGLESRRRSISQALETVGNAKNYLAIADLLQIIKEKTVQGADDSFSSEQRVAIQDTINALVLEIDDIIDETQYQGLRLINGTFTGKKFQTGAAAGDVFDVDLGTSADAATLGVAGLDVSSSSTASAAIAAVDGAITTLNSRAQQIGQFLVRLSSKEETLAVAITNTESARSRIEDADFAREQLDLVRFQIIQQTAFSSFAQANTAPQLVLSLFR